MPPHGANLWIPDSRRGRPLFSGLTDYWRLDEVSGNRAALIGGRTLTDNATVTSDAGAGALTGRTTAHFTRANLEFLSVVYSGWDTRPFSFVVWVRNDSPGTESGVLGEITEVPSGVMLTGSTAFGAFFGYVNQSLLVNSVTFNSPAPTWSNWNMLHCGFLAESNTIRVGINNGTIVSGVGSGSAGSGGSTFNVGKNSVGVGVAYWEGSMAHLMRFNKILTQADVNTLYNSGNGYFL